MKGKLGLLLVAEEHTHVLVLVLGEERVDAVCHDVRVRGGIGDRWHAFENSVNIDCHTDACAMLNGRHAVLEVPLCGGADSIHQGERWRHEHVVVVCCARPQASNTLKG